MPKNWCWVWLPVTFENHTDSKKKVQQKTYLEDGRVSVVDQGQELVGGYTDDESMLYSGELPVVIFGDHTRCIKYIDFPFAQGADGVKVLKPKAFYSPKAFYYSLQAVDIPNMGYRRHFPLFDQYAMPVPPPAEQQRIVVRIEDLFAKLDEAKEKAQSVLDSFETRKAAILHKAFTGELTAKWRAEQRVSFETWKSSPLAEITTVVSGYAFSSKDFSEENTVPCIKITNVGVGEYVADDYEFLPESYLEEYERFAVKKGDILISLTRSFINAGLKVCICEEERASLLNQRVALIKNCNTGYIFYYLRSDDVLKYVKEKSKTTNQPNLSIKDLNNMLIAVPCADEQSEIVRILDSLFAKEQQAKEAAEAVLEKIDLLKKSILARAFRGELGTNDPAEQSVLELLKCIL